MKVERAQDILPDDAADQAGAGSSHHTKRSRASSEGAPKSAELSHDEPKLVWTRENPNRLAGVTRSHENLPPAKPEASAKSPEAAKPKPRKAPAKKRAAPTKTTRQPAAAAARELAKPQVDYSRFFWAESGPPSSKTDSNSHDILPSTEPKTAEAPAPHIENIAPASELSAMPEQLPATPAAPEQLPARPTAPAESHAAAYADQPELSADQLVQLAQTIQVGETNLYKMYETRQIDAEGLHNVVQEYLRGGNVREALTSEMIQTQLKYEKDPHLKRRKISSGVKSATAKAGVAANAVKSKTAQKVNRQTAQRHAKNVSHHSGRIYDFYRDLYEDYPLLFQVMAVIIGVVLYFAVLALIIKA